MDIERVKSAAQGLTELDPDEAKAAIRQFELRTAAADESGPLSTPLAEYRTSVPDVPPILVDPALVVRGGVTVTVGRAGKGKTMMNLNRLMAWAGGRPMFPGLVDALAPCGPLKTLVVENEGAAVMFHRKVNRMFDNGDFDREQRELIDRNFLVWGDGGYSGLKLTDSGLLQLRSELDRTKPDILFIEPLRFLHTGEENSATEMAVVLDALAGLAAEFQIGIILSHHERKGGIDEDGEMMSAARGSTALEGAVDVMENFRAVKGGDFRELSWSKSRYEEAPPPVRMAWDHPTHWYSHIPESAGGHEVLAVLTAAGAPLSVKMIAEEVGESEAKTRRILAKLADDDPPRISRFAVPGQGYMYRVDTINGSADRMEF